MNAIVDLIESVSGWLQSWEFYAIVIIGIVMIIVGVVRIAMLFMRGQGPGHPPVRGSEWLIAILTILIGGAIMYGGYNLVGGIALDMTSNTINELNNNALAK